MLILLTGQPDMETAYGAARRFWKRLRDRWGELTYFCWLELTAAGAPHYHALLINPPAGFWRRESKAFMEEAWGNRYVKCESRSARWFNEQAGAYATAYTKKMGAKEYQQDYDAVPRELRTFMCQRLPHTGRELRAHESTAVVAHVPEKWCVPTGEYTPAHLVHWADDMHAGDRCSLVYVTKSMDLQRRADRSARANAWRSRVDCVDPPAHYPTRPPATRGNKDQFGAIGEPEESLLVRSVVAWYRLGAFDKEREFRTKPSPFKAIDVHVGAREDCWDPLCGYQKEAPGPLVSSQLDLELERKRDWTPPSSAS